MTFSLYRLAVGTLARGLQITTAFLLLGSTQLVAAPQVAATIKPLQLIAAAVTKGISVPDLVLGAGQDPHVIALRPSERRAIGNADVLIWIGPALEQPLAELVATLDATVLTLQTQPSLRLLETTLGLDPHLWLSPQAATAIADLLATALIELDPQNALLYTSNLNAFSAQMSAVQQQLTIDLKRSQGPWVVDHYAYRYFVDAFALPEPLVLRESDNREPGLRTVAGLRAAMAQDGLNCIVAEPGENADELRSLLGNPELRVIHADPMGQQVEANAFAFATLLADIAAGISACMGGVDE